MDLAQLNDTANLLKLLQQFGGDTDMADKEIEAVINTCLEFGLKSTIMDDFRLLVQISVRDEPSDRSFSRIGKECLFLTIFHLVPRQRLLVGRHCAI